MRSRGLVVLAFFFALFLLGCSAEYSDTATVSTKDVGLSFASEQKLIDHWQKHGMNPQEFNPPLTKEQYLQKARALFTSAEAEIEQKYRDNGDSLRYRPSTNEFGVLSAAQKIRTYFRPSSGRQYWERQ